MGLILQDKSIDDVYSADVIQKARDLSPEIDEYVVTQRYLLDTSEENLSPLWLRNRLISMVLEQLSDRGIGFSLDEDVVIDSPEMVQAALYLRSKFDQDNLFDLFKDHPDVRQYVSEVVEGDECIDDFIGYCASVMPLDEGWECLKRVIDAKPGIITSTDVFNELLSNVLERVDRLGEPSLITASNENVVLAYVGFLGKRKQMITKLASVMYSGKVIANESLEGGDAVPQETAMQMSEIRIKTLENTMSSNFENELTRPSVLKSLDPTEAEIKLGDIRDKFVTRWRHTLEYWIQPGNTGIPSDLEVAIMVATIYVDNGANQFARVKVVESLENVAEALGERYGSFRDLFDNAMANLVVMQESEVK